MKNYNLNEKQVEAAEYFNSPLRIIAGAGTGKTSVIVAKIKKILDLNIAPEKICAITFTNKAANEIKERVIKSLGIDFDSINIGIYTYHAFCRKILLEDIHLLGYENGIFTIIDTNKKRKIIKDLYKSTISNFDKEDYRMDNKNVKLLMNDISKYKRILPIKDINSLKYLPEFSSKKDHLKNLIKIWPMYENYLKSNLLVDYDSMISLVYELFLKNPNIVEKWKQRIDYFLIDEFQDTSLMEFEVIQFLTTTNITVVGDPDQNIYSWRGADLKLLLDFDKKFDNCKTVILDLNYRSITPILKVANNLIKNNYKKSTKLFKKLISNKTTENYLYKPELFNTESYELEIKEIIKKINYLVNNENYNLEDITILYRSNFLSKELTRELTKNNLVFNIIGGTSFFESPEIRRMITLLHFVLVMNNYTILEAISFFPGIGEKTIEKLKIKSSEYNVKILDVIKYHRNDFDTQTNNKIKIFSNVIEKYFDLLKFKSFYEICNSLIKDFKVLEYYEELPEKKDNIQQLLMDIMKFEKQNPNMKIPDLLNDYLDKIALDTNDGETKNNAITLMTIHKAKGTENKIIFVVSVCEDILPSKYTTSTEEERRLFYVAITRAKEKLFISYNTGYNWEGSYSKSKFLKEIENNDNELLKNLTIIKPKEKVNEFQNGLLSKTNKDSLSFSIDSQVKHPFFGVGKVTEIINENLIKIEFKNHTREVNQSILELIKK